MLELMISDISKSLSHRHHCDVEQTTKCWRNSVGQTAPGEGMDRPHFGLGLFLELKKGPDL